MARGPVAPVQHFRWITGATRLPASSAEAHHARMGTRTKPASRASRMAENALRLGGTWPVAGVDEAGRGPWAGPVVAAAVILPGGRAIRGLADSKQLTADERCHIHAEITARAQYGVGIVDVETIDRINILQATLLAMCLAIEALPTAPAAALVDGNIVPKLACPARAVVCGDATVAAIAAASIVAKVVRDRLMIALCDGHPGYNWRQNKGYGTPEHAAGLARLGPTPHHRASFAPIRTLLAGGTALPDDCRRELR